MFKKLILAFALSALADPAFAACTNPLVIKDGSAASISMSMTSNADGFCQYNFNMAQINGVVPLMGNGATGTGSPRVTIANDNTIPTGWPTATNQTAAAAAKGEGATGAAVPSGAQYMGLNSSGNLLGWAAKAGNTYAATDVVPGVAVVNTQVSVTPGDGITTTIYGTAPASPVIGVPLLWNGTTYDRWKSSGSTGIAAAGLFQGATALSATNGIFANVLQGNAVLSATNPSFARSTDGTRSAIIDPCEANVQTFAPILMTTATTLRIIAPSASNKNYICSLFLKASAADNVALVEGTGGSCVTGIAGIIGGSTTANGFVFGTAGDGVLLQSGGKTAIAQTVGTNVDTCLITSTTGPLIGGVRYVQAP